MDTRLESNRLGIGTNTEPGATQRLTLLGQMTHDLLKALATRQTSLSAEGLAQTAFGLAKAELTLLAANGEIEAAPQWSEGTGADMAAEHRARMVESGAGGGGGPGRDRDREGAPTT